MAAGIRRGFSRITGGSASWQVGWGYMAESPVLPGVEMDSLHGPFSVRNVNMGGLAVVQVAPSALAAAGLTQSLRPSASSVHVRTVSGGTLGKRSALLVG